MTGPSCNLLKIIMLFDLQVPKNNSRKIKKLEVVWVSVFWEAETTVLAPQSNHLKKLNPRHKHRDIYVNR